VKKERADHLLVERGLAESGSKARALIMAGVVYSGETRVEKAGIKIPVDSPLKVKQKACPFVSRGGLKLNPVLDKTAINVEGMICADIGASTGGFTDCLLQRGASKIYAVDVGRGQLHVKRANDPKVVVRDKVNARYLDSDFFQDPIDLVVVDVSFISLKLILPAISESAPKAEILAMVKPQFEAGRERVGKGGVIRDNDVREETVQGVADFAANLGYDCIGMIENSIKGPKGNIETFLYLRPSGSS